MSTITYVKLGSVPITEEGVERYKFSDSIESHITQIAEFTENINCSVGRIFSKMKLPVSWISVMNANYLIADLEFNNPANSSLHIRAWIDSIEPLSDTEDYPMCEVRWHFDYFEMYKSTITLGYGHVKRRPFNDLDSTPIQNYDYRYLKVDESSKSEIFPRYSYNVGSYGSGKLWWIIFCYNQTVGSLTYFRYGASPVWVADNKDANGNLLIRTPMIQKSGDNTVYTVISIANVYNGLLDEYFGISPSSINGIWLSPYCHIQEKITGGTGDLLDPLKFDSSVIIESNSVAFIRFDAVMGFHKERTFVDPIMSDEKERWIVLNSDGTKALDLPYGMSISKYDIEEIVEPDSVYFVVSFKDGIKGRAEGCMATISLPSIPINTNALSDYVYSGQRDYDRDMRTLLTNANAIKSIAAGAGQGAMMGAFGARGLLIGSAGGALGGSTNYLTETFYQNDREQALLDRLKANQISSLVMGSYAILSLIGIEGQLLIKLVMDTYSGQVLENNRVNFGISVDEILSSCDDMVRTQLPTGYYSIKNLIISGSVPKEAKDYIKNKFDAGVKLL